MKKLFKILIAFFAFCFITFAFIIPLNPPVGNWYQQFMPNVGGRSISDITFIDSLTGWAVTPYFAVNDTSFVLKTSNGGDDWFIQHTRAGQFVGSNRVVFLNANTGYTAGGSWLPTYSAILKTTNGGNTWSNISPPTDPFTAKDISILNEDTFWVVSDNSLTGGVFFTSNGGASWQNQLFLGSQNPTKIYMYNGNTGYIAKNTGSSYIRKTTNSGLNWDTIVNGRGFYDMFFVDGSTGWSAFDSVRITTNGGLNWLTQVLPYGFGITTLFSTRFSNIDTDTIWMGGGRIIYPNSQVRGVLFRTTNGGNNWLFQIPDTAVHSGLYLNVQFVDKFKGWAYWGGGGVHTTTGGDTIFYLGIVQTSNSIPKDFALKQNYPNPFNPRTVIPYSIKRSAYVKLIAYDILGRENQKLVDQHQSAGEYEVDFMGKFASSGVYFYRIEVTDDNSKQLYTETKKMILIK